MAATVHQIRPKASEAKVRPVARPPTTETVEQAYLDTLSAWTIEGVKAALDAHEQGDFAESSVLYGAAMRDPQIYSCLATRVSALSARAGLPFSVDPAEGVDDRRAKSVASRIEARWWTACPESAIAALDRDGIMLGVGVGRVAPWRVEIGAYGPAWVPTLRRLRPHGLLWNESEKRFEYRSLDGKTHVVTPGENGWVLHAPFGGDSWMMGAIRALGNSWVTRALTRRDRSRYSEKYGLPILAVKEPYAAPDDIEGSSGSANPTIASYYAQFRNITPRSVIREPRGPEGKDGWEARFISPEAGSSFAVFRETLADERREIAAVLLGRDPELPAAVGGDGASLLARVEVEKLSTDAEGMATTLREQVWKPYVAYNIDPARPELAGWPRWDTRPTADLGARAVTLDKAADALAKLIEMGADVAPILEEFHLTAAKPLEAPPPPAAAEPPAEEAEE